MYGCCCRIARGTYRVRVRLELGIQELRFTEGMKRTQSGHAEALLTGVDCWMIGVATRAEKTDHCLSNCIQDCCACVCNCFGSCGQALTEPCFALGPAYAICSGFFIFFGLIGWPILVLMLPYIIYIYACTCLLFLVGRPSGVCLMYLASIIFVLVIPATWAVVYSAVVWPAICPDSQNSEGDYDDESFPCMFSRWVYAILYVVMKILCFIGQITGSASGNSCT